MINRWCFTSISLTPSLKGCDVFVGTAGSSQSELRLNGNPARTLNSHLIWTHPGERRNDQDWYQRTVGQHVTKPEKKSFSKCFKFNNIWKNRLNKSKTKKNQAWTCMIILFYDPNMIFHVKLYQEFKGSDINSCFSSSPVTIDKGKIFIYWTQFLE